MSHRKTEEETRKEEDREAEEKRSFRSIRQISRVG